MTLTPAIRDALAGVTTATLTTVLLKKGVRSCYIAGAKPILPGGGRRIVGPAFTLRFTPGAGGGFSGTIGLVNDDANENPFDLVLQGTGVAQAPEISVLLGTTHLATGGTLDFGQEVARI